MPADFENQFYLQVAAALGSCQSVEIELKLYITDAFDCVRKFSPPTLTFKFSGQDYAGASLERLIDVFKKLSDNDDLVKRLNAFKEKRNELAHRGVAQCHDYDGELSSPEASRYLLQLTEIQQEASMLRGAVREEAAKFQGHLWFEPVNSAA